MADITENLYAERDIMAMGNYYMRHVDRMTREGLHAKSDIAAELGFRDMEIDRLRARVAELEAERVNPETHIVVPRDPTQEMIDAFMSGVEQGECYDTGYVAMLNAAPEHPAYTAPPTPRVDVDAISDERIQFGSEAYFAECLRLGIMGEQSTDRYIRCMRAALRAMFNKGE